MEQGAEGRSEHYARVRLDGEHPAGSLVDATVTGSKDGVLIAKAND